MLSGFYPTTLDEKGRPQSISLFQFLASDSLEEIKPYAVQAAKEMGKRQFIVCSGGNYVLFEEHWKSSVYFSGAEIVAQFSKTGKETQVRKR